MSDKLVRYHVVRHTITLIHEYPAEYDDSAEFALTENGCFGNVINDLYAAHAVDEQYCLCSVCAAHSAQYIGVYDSPELAEQAGWRLLPKTTPYDLNRKRRRAANESVFKPDDADPEDG